MLSDETKSLIHLNLMQGVGSKTIQLLVEAFGSAEAALQATSATQQSKLWECGSPAPAGLIHKLLYYPLQRELELIERHGCGVITLYDEMYPPLLKEINNPPILLYVKGELHAADHKSIALVGSRQSTEEGLRLSHKLSYALAKHGVTVVSGLARGIDESAHRGALEADGRTLAVIGRGLCDVYPPENRNLAAQIVKSGALLSEFPMAMEVRRQNFPQRNRIISGLTRGTVIGEAPKGSGALITARHAREQEREVFALSSEPLSGIGLGTQELISNRQATFIHETEPLLKLFTSYRPRRKPAQVPESPQLFLVEPRDEARVVTAVVGYFKTPAYQRFSIELEREIRIGSRDGRADVVLLTAEGKLAAIAECKVAYEESGDEQLKSYLSATDTRFGILADSEHAESWQFYENIGRSEFKRINLSQFEKGILGDVKKTDES